MLIHETKVGLERFLRDREVDLTSMGPRSAVVLMTEWYESQPVERLASDFGDMLLFQWGDHGPGERPPFQLDLVRQFIAADEAGDDAIWQLHLTLLFPSDAASGNEGHWSDESGDLNEYREMILDKPVLRELADRIPDRVEIWLDMAG